MNIFDVLYVGKTGKIKPDASLMDNLFGKKFYDAHSAEEKTIDFTPVISVSDAIAGAVIDYKCKITAVQSGSGDPSPTNIRPIEGRTEIGLNGCGKNLFDKSKIALVPTNSEGEIRYRYGVTVPVKAGKYTVSCRANTETIQNVYTYTRLIKNGVYGTVRYVQTPTQTNTITFVCDDGDSIVLYDERVSDNEATAKLKLDTAQIEKGETATAYEPYTQGVNITINLGGTYYGGTLDVVTGELTVTHIKKKIGDESITWNYQSSGGRLYTQSLNNIIVKAPNNQTAFPEIIKCTCYKTVSATSTGASTGNLGIAVSNSGAIYLRDENYSNASDFVRDMGDEYILYQLAEPITYTLTPTQIELVEGANTLWADTGDSKMTYLAKK